MLIKDDSCGYISYSINNIVRIVIVGASWRVLLKANCRPAVTALCSKELWPCKDKVPNQQERIKGKSELTQLTM